ncbi:zinc finger HIT domain-containing protein 1-like [Orbicella faveolata]|uniref:zinc finger HIT domain-containing protein 1-like n=1 Tax=Orbicella faveolata TaxID=48498 RepID=UPI0009E6437F|nr:zinc finger HIT domain-containing protein 1-like [Orbicella faveolata]
MINFIEVIVTSLARVLQKLRPSKTKTKTVGKHSHLTVVPAKMKVPAFNDTMEDKRKKRKSKTGELFKQRFRRTFAMLLEEAQQEAEAGEPSYNSANVPPSKFPERHFCSVCGYPLFQNLFHN